MQLYSPEWVEAFNRAADQVAAEEVTAAQDATGITPEETHAPEAAGTGGGGPGDFRLLQVVHGAPGGTVRVGLESSGGRLVMTREPPTEPAPEVTLTVEYQDAVALSRGDIDPARLISTGRVKVRGNLSVLVAGQSLLARVAARVAPLPGGPAG